MSKHFQTRWVALLVLMACLPAAAQDQDLPQCAIASIQMGALTAGLPLNEPQLVQGAVEVRCSGTATGPQTLEFGLIELSGEPAHDGRSATATAPARPIRVDLFSDGAGRQALPVKASALNDYSNRRVIPSAGTAQLSIPFYARVVVQTLLSAGNFDIARDIGLVYRISDHP